jgi:hypothetical protein
MRVIFISDSRLCGVERMSLGSSCSVVDKINYYCERPNILKFKQIMCTSEKIKLEKLCRFIRKINRSDILLANT